MDVSARHFVSAKYSVILFGIRLTAVQAVCPWSFYSFSIPDELCRLEDTPSSHGLSSLQQDRCLLMEKAG